MEKASRLTNGAKVWCVLCIAANVGILGFLLFTTDYIAASERSAYIPLAVSILSIAGFFVLLCGRRLGYFMVLACALIGILESLLSGSLGFANIAAGILNPSLTFLFLRKCWQNLIPVRLFKSPLSIACAAALLLCAVLTVVFAINPLGVSDKMTSLNGPVTIQDDSGNILLVSEDFISAGAVRQGDFWGIELKLTNPGRAKLREATKDNVMKVLLVCVGEQVIFSPNVNG